MTDMIANKSAALLDNINAQIQSINDFIRWSEHNLHSTRRLETFKKLVNQRRALKRCLFSLSSNPAIAAFGESQKGKSYVISNLLSYKGQPFMVDGGDGRQYNFIEEINQISRDTESTSVVTRFTYDLSTPAGYPVKIKLLSVADMILILCDSYFNDIESQTVIEEEDLNAFAREKQARYQSLPDVQDWLDEDALFDIRDYLEKYARNGAREILKSEYFDVLVGVVRKIGPDSWPEVFSKLWGDNPHITALFSRLVSGYVALNFSGEVYVPISAVLNRSITLMGTPCLATLEEKGPLVGNRGDEKGADVAYYASGMLKVVGGFNKGILCAMTSEVVYRIDANAVDEEKLFCLDGLDPARAAILKDRGWNEPVTRSFLKDNDILDFPGARSRLQIDESKIPVELCKQMFLRGKVAYLFNKYSDNRLINILMFCHDYMQVGPTVMPQLLKKWISSYVGETVEMRDENIAKSVISPLFLIATKFNKDLEMQASAIANEQASRRWSERFDKVLYRQVLMATSNDWFDSWTSSASFKNTYLLRDFKFSGDVGGDASKLFSGYMQEGRETRELDADFRTRLRQSFVSDPTVGKFFSDPEESWDAASTMNNDGSNLIIRNLSVAARHTKDARNYMFEKEIKAVRSTVHSLMRDYYHDEDQQSILDRKLSTCGSVVAELDIVCGNDPYFFGRMVQNLQVRENKVFDFYYSFLNRPHVSQATMKSEYVNILSRCGGRISSSRSFEDNLEILRQSYRFGTAQACREFFESKRGIVLEKLFACVTAQTSNSHQMGSGIVNMWLETLSDQKNVRFYECAGCDTIVILDLIENIRAVATEVKLSEIIASRISPYVDMANVSLEILDMIADMTAAIINSFVTDFGYRYYSAEKREEIRKLNGQNNLYLNLDFDTVPGEPADENELASLFDKMRPTDEHSGEDSVDTPVFVNYQRWIEYLQVSFIAAFNVPDYNVEANRQLGCLLDKYCAIS